MKLMHLAAIAFACGALISSASAALAFGHEMRRDANGFRYYNGPRYYDGRSVYINRFGPAGATPFNPAGTTPFNPAGATPFNPAGSTPFNPAGGGLR